MFKKIFLTLLIGVIWMSLDSHVSAQSKTAKPKNKKEASASDKYENFPSSKNPGSSDASYKRSRQSVKKAVVKIP